MSVTVVRAYRYALDPTPAQQRDLLRHAGAILAYSSTVAYLLYRRAGALEPGAWHRILGNTTRRMLPSSFGILMLVSMAVIMSHAGMTDELASGIASAVGGAFPLVSSWIGALGAFMTGSNTNSNAVFAGLQMDTAVLMGLSVSMVLAIQTSSAAIASLLAPAKILVGASTVGISGDEGLVLRNLLLYGGILLLIIAGLGFVLLQLGY